MTTQNDLSKLKESVTNQIAEWAKRNKFVKQAPFPSDYPCYYCEYSGKEEWKFACKYCIHNPEAIIWDLKNGDHI